MSSSQCKQFDLSIVFICLCKSTVSSSQSLTSVDYCLVTYKESLSFSGIVIVITQSCLLYKVGHIEKVFAAALKKKAWDHFSKAQRKNIDLWYKQAKVGTLARQVVVYIYMANIPLSRVKNIEIIKVTGSDPRMKMGKFLFHAG